VTVHIHTSHVGYLPEARKVAVFGPEYAGRDRFVVRDAANHPLTNVVFRGPLEPAPCLWGDCAVADFTDLTTEGRFQIVAGDHDSVSVSEPAAGYPFNISRDVYVKTLRMAFDYFRWQRCGVEVPGYHKACHLDDAVREDTGRHVDTTGGWHDAGDLRKWIITTILYVHSMLELHERLAPPWNAHGADWPDVMDEARWGNAYLLKMQDPETGKIWHDVAGGVAGDNSDCRWTDNRIGTGDERRIWTERGGGRSLRQWTFIRSEAKMHRLTRQRDDRYARTCLDAARRCLDATGLAPSGRVDDDAAAVTALIEMHRATGHEAWRQAASEMARSVIACQEQTCAHGQEVVRGYFYADTTRERLWRHHSLMARPLEALATIADTWPDDPVAAEAREAARIYVQDYLWPMADRTPYAMIPHGLYLLGPAGDAVARPVGGELTFRFFNWREATSRETAAHETETFEHGQNSHNLYHAVALLLADRVLEGCGARELALRQLEWIMGANPLAACMMTGAGANLPLPFSMFVGTIPGGMVNGFNGGPDDLPNLHPGNTLDWETGEYWGTHNAHYMWALSILLEGQGLSL
jgi:hypothetical protein